MKIIISPFSKPMRPLPRSPINPKNYPYWKEVVILLQKIGHYVIQIGITGEDSIGASETKFDLSLDELRDLLFSCETWASVDNFFQHFATYYGRPGVVIFGKSDPRIFGYDQNVNLLKGREFLRKDQFDIWEKELFEAHVFVNPEEVAAAIHSIPNNGDKKGH